MPELVEELPPAARAWKRPALDMARDNPGVWVRCDGEHPQDTPWRWRQQRTGRHCLPDGFEVAGRQQGAPVGRVFVYVRWVGDTDG